MGLAPLTSVEILLVFLCDYNVKFLGHVMHHWKGIFNFQNFQLVKPKKICSLLVIAEQAGQNNCNGKTRMFSTSALKESRESTYYWKFLLVRIS